MIKTSPLLLISLWAFQPTHAQLDSLVDVFPLAVGNQWVYRYHLFYIDWFTQNGVTDTGTVRLLVTGRISAGDSVRWQLHEARDLVRRIWPGGPVYFPFRDSTDFEIIELQNGRHKLYTSYQETRLSVLPFFAESPDSACVYRYQVVDSTGTISVVFVSFDFRLLFQRSVGELTAVCQQTGFSVSHQLVGFVLVSVQEGLSEYMPRQIVLCQNYPNPFNPTTTIEYNLPHKAHVSLKLYDVLGREAITLVEMEQQAGVHRATFNASREVGIASGLYFYCLRAGDFVATRKLLFLK